LLGTVRPNPFVKSQLDARDEQGRVRETVCPDPSVLIAGDRDLLDLAATVPRTAGLRRRAILTPRAFTERVRPRGATKR